MSRKYIEDTGLDWSKVRRVAFNERSNPDDDELGIQIVKDLHRTGCSTFSAAGHDSDKDRALLKRVLLAFARHNKTVGYCQGFNIIAALILEIVEKRADDALMCMIYLIEHVIPDGYFTNSMHKLAIDMAVFRELLKAKLPKLCQHLNALQFNSMSDADAEPSPPPPPPPVQPSSRLFFGNKSKSSSNSTAKKKTPAVAATSGASSCCYEPPLTNVFTMQWFLTLFATCLPKDVLLRVWDGLFLEGAEVLFRTSIAIWDKLAGDVMRANSADAFYTSMSVLAVRLLDANEPSDANELIAKIYSYGAFPMPGLYELREKFTFNITPFRATPPAKPQKTSSDSSASRRRQSQQLAENKKNKKKKKKSSTPVLIDHIDRLSSTQVDYSRTFAKNLMKC